MAGSGEPEQDVAGALVSALAADGEFVDDGGFRLDVGTAREKLAAYQLASPAHSLLLLVEAGHLLRGCTGVSFEFGRSATRIELAGVALGDDELREWFDPAFIGGGALADADARHLLGRQRLALALNTALNLPSVEITLTSRIVGREGWRATLDDDGGVTLEVDAELSGSSSLVVELQRGWLPLGAELLRERAGDARVPILCDGERIDGRSPAAELVATVTVDDEGARIVAGWSPSCVPAAILLIANGVLIERIDQPEHPDGSLAVVDASALERDLSQARFIHDDAFARVLAAAERARERVPGPAPVRVPSIEYGEQARSTLAVVIFAAFGVGFGVMLAAIDSWLGSLMVTSMFVLFFGVSAPIAYRCVLEDRRVRALEREGSLGLAVVERAARRTGASVGTMLEVEVGLRLEGPGAVVSPRMLLAKEAIEQLEVGSRVFVRYDPAQPERLVFA